MRSEQCHFDQSGRLETPRQLAERVGLTEGAIKLLISQGKLSFVEVGKRLRIPPGAWDEYLQTYTVKKWRDETKDRSSSSMASGTASISSGPTTGAVASAALARQIAQRLKSNSRSSCSDGPVSKAPVIPLKSS